MATLALGGVGVAMGGYAYRQEAPRAAVISYVVGAGLIAGAVLSGIYLLVRAVPLPPSAQVPASKPIDMPSPVVRWEPVPTTIPSTMTPPTLLAPASNKPESQTGLTARYILSLLGSNRSARSELTQNLFRPTDDRVRIVTNVELEDDDRIASVQLKVSQDIYIGLDFHEPWIERVTGLTRGDAITARGKLAAATGFTLLLDHCEIVKLGE